MPLASTHKHLIVGLVVGILAYHFWMQRAGKKSSPEGS